MKILASTSTNLVVVMCHKGMARIIHVHVADPAMLLVLHMPF